MGLELLFDTADFPARWRCGNWSAVHGWTHIVSDVAIWAAYTAIPVVLGFVALRRRDLGFPRVLWLFVAFILACGATHLIEAIIFWFPIYRIGAVVKVVTAVVSWATVLTLLYYGPTLLRMTSVTEINLQLDREVQRRREVERRIVEQARTLQVALAAGHIGTWRWDLKTGEHYSDGAYNAILGRDPRPVTESVESFLECIHPDDRETVRAAPERAIDGSDELEGEARIVRPDGRTRWIRGSGTLMRDEHGEPQLMTGAVVDETQRRQAEQQQARLAAIVENSPDAMMLQSIKGKILTWNRGAERIFGYSPEEAEGESIRLIVPDDRLEELEQTLAAVGRGEEIAELETFRRRKDGVQIPVWLSISPLRDARGKVRVLSTVERDLTDRVRNEDQLRRLNSDLRSKNEEMEQFVYIVSHDLKSPLVTIMGFVGLLREELDERTSDDVTDGLSRIDGAAQRMSQLIDDLLELSRIGQVKDDSRPVDLARMCEELRSDLAEPLDEADAVLDFSEELGTIDADPRRARQVLQNLVTNAIRYGCPEPGGRIEIGAERDYRESRVYVRDFGPGINPEHQKRIFRLFERVDSRPEGTGVGLALVAKIMAAHRGRVWVESERGRGATFWVAFPRLAQTARPGPGRDGESR